MDNFAHLSTISHYIRGYMQNSPMYKLGHCESGTISLEIRFEMFVLL